MFFKEEIEIHAAPEIIFSRYADVGNWSKWDADVKEASLFGEFSAGSEGVITPLKGPKAHFILSKVNEGRSFTSKTRLPLCTIHFEHLLEPIGKTTRVTHGVTFDGALSSIWGWLIGSQIRRGLPHALNGLKRVCESDYDK